MSKWIAGYRILQPRERDDWGASYQAFSLARGGPVLVRVLRADWARDAVYTARLVRNLFAVSQLEHPNLARVLGVGDTRGTVYFVQEWVAGSSLAEIRKQRSKLDPRSAAALVLQAARGLAFAHRQGLFHGDLRLESFLLDGDGTVKVTNLGLVRSPAQAEALDQRDTAPASKTNEPPPPGADRATLTRVDRIALGWTFIELLTGRDRPAASGGAPPANDLIAAGVPRALVEIVTRFIAEDGFHDLDAVVVALEGCLKVPGPEGISALEDAGKPLATAADQFRDAPWARLRTRILAGWFGGCAGIALLSALIGWKVLAWGFFDLGILTALAYFLVDGLAKGGPLAGRLRSLVFGARLADWLTALVVVGLLLAVAVAIKAVGVLLAFGLATAVFVIAVRREVDRFLDAERAEPLASARSVLQRLRLQGLAELTLQRLVFLHAGPRWRSWFQALFGAEATRSARLRWGEASRFDGMFLRDSLLARLDNLSLTRRLERDRDWFQRLEERRLCARGVNLLTARRRGHRIADALVGETLEWHHAIGPDGPELALGPMLDRAAGQPDAVLVETERGGRLGSAVSSVLNVLFGARTRFLLGVALLAGFVAWLDLNGMLPRQRLLDLATRATEIRDLEAAGKLGQEAGTLRLDLSHPAQPFQPELYGSVFAGFGAGLAGLILVVSAFFHGPRMSLFALPAALIAVFGPRLGLPSVGPLDPEHLSLAVAAGVAVLGWFFGRQK